MEIQVLEEKLANREEVIHKLLEIFENTTHQPLVDSILKQLTNY